MKLFALKRFLGKSRESEALARAYARCFNTPDGQIVLEHLQHHSLCRVIDPNMPQSHLRFVEGQRQLVLFICQMIAKASTPSNPTHH